MPLPLRVVEIRETFHARWNTPPVAPPLPCFASRQQIADDEAKLVRMLLETGVSVEEATPKLVSGATAPGDWQRLRGLPAVSRGCAGHIRGTDPLGEVIRRESRQRRKR